MAHAPNPPQLNRFLPTQGSETGARADPATPIGPPPPQRPVAPALVEPDRPAPVHPTARPAHLRPRHWGLILSFFLIVAVPLAALTAYLTQIAHDQYASTTGFTVRSDDGSAAADVLGGLASMAGAGTGADADILFEFITSQDIVRRLDQRLDLSAHYAAPFQTDPILALSPQASIEDLVDHWQRIVRVSFDRSSGLIELRVLAFDPGMAQTIAQQIIAESQSLVNELNAQARADSMRFAQTDLDTARARLRSAREALTRFRTRTQIVDPASDLRGRMGVLNTLQQQLAEALIEHDLLSGTTANPADPRVTQAERRIAVIQDRIVQERRHVTSDEIGAVGQDYPTLMAEFEGLMVEREFAEESYRAALAAVDVARTNAARQSRYLAVFIQPTLPESAGFPRRGTVLGLAALFLSLAWAILALIYYSVRDRQ